MDSFGGGGVAVAKSGRRRDWPTPQEFWAEHSRRVALALTRFGTSFMSDAKWRKAFRVLADPALGIVGYRWKFVADDRTSATEVVGEKEIEERHLRDGRFPPYAYKEIEWLEVRTARPDEATEALARAGRFPVRPCDAGIRLLGYG
jgi:hypothetical protein